MFYSFRDQKTYINIRATTRASKNCIGAIRDNELTIFVTAVPENNRANVAIIGLLSKKLGVSKSQIQIVSGQKSRNKVLCIDVELNEKILNSVMAD